MKFSARFDAPARANEALAQNVLLGDQRRVGGLETGIEAEHGERDLRGADSASACGHDATGARLSSRCSASTCAMRSREPSLHMAMTTRLPAACSAFDVFGHRVKDAGGGLVPLGSEVMAGMHAGLDGVRGAFGRGERRQAGERGIVEPFAPFGFGKIKPIRRQRLIGRAAARLVERVLARLIIVGDLREPLVGGFFGERLDRDRRAFDVIEQRFQPGVKQRQPMLDAGGAAAFAHRFVEHVVGRRRRRRRRHSRCGTAGSCRGVS